MPFLSDSFIRAIPPAIIFPGHESWHRMITFFEFWAYVGKWSLIGAVGFTLLLVLAIVTKAFQLARDEEGQLRKPMPMGGRILMGDFS